MVLASANPKKAAELDSILSALSVMTADGRPVDLLARPDDVPEVVEDAPDFVGNARLKAVALSSATGLPALADDSGLEVDALGGAPGVYSARYSGEHATDADNVEHLLAELDRVGAVTAGQPDPGGGARAGGPGGGACVDGAPARTARFRCVVLLRSPEGEELVAEGSVEGHIAVVPAGGGGFGYDPVFVPDDGDGRTFAQMTSEEKQAISHRGRALRSLAAQLAR